MEIKKKNGDILILISGYIIHIIFTEI